MFKKINVLIAKLFIGKPHHPKLYAPPHLIFAHYAFIYFRLYIILCFDFFPMMFPLSSKKLMNNYLFNRSLLWTFR